MINWIFYILKYVNETGLLCVDVFSIEMINKFYKTHNLFKIKFDIRFNVSQSKQTSIYEFKKGLFILKVGTKKKAKKMKI